MDIPALFWLNMFWVLVCAAAFGSFANVLIYRLPLMIFGAVGQNDSSDKKLFNIAFPASFCPQCRQAIKWWHNIPSFR